MPVSASMSKSAAESKVVMISAEKTASSSSITERSLRLLDQLSGSSYSLVG